MNLTRENLCVLVVEDDDMDYELLAATLHAAGFTHPLTRLGNGEAAIEYFKYAEAAGSEVPHVILMDINMPLMGGIDALQLLRKRPLFNDLPVIMLSGIDEPSSRREAVHHGIFRFLKKLPDCSNVISALDDFLGFYNHPETTRPFGGYAASRPGDP